MSGAKNSPIFQRDIDAPVIKFTDVNGFSRPLESETDRSVHSFQSELTAPIYQDSGNIRTSNGHDTFRPYVASAGDLATPLREKRLMARALQNGNGNKIITNLAGDVISGNPNSIYQRKNLKPMNFYGRESAPSTPVITSRKNYGRFNSYQSPTGPTPPPPLSTRSIYSHHTHGHGIPPASTEREKRKMTRRFFSTVSGISYAIFLVIFGAIVFIGDVVIRQYPLPQAFCIYMLVVSFAYFLFLYMDIRLHVHRAKQAISDRESRQQLIEDYINRMNVEFDGPVELGDCPITNTFYSRAIQELNLPPIKPVSHKYCFMTGRHGEFLYLKLGAAWFAIGLLIHSILQIAYQIFFLSSNGEEFNQCASYIVLVLDILFPIYSWFILFFIVKYINVIINEHRSAARLFLFHAIGTSLAFWIFTIVRETADAIALSSSYNNSTTEGDHRNGTEHVNCAKFNALNTIHQKFSPYLYPFIIEYNILIVGIWYMMWANINHCPRKVSTKPGNGHENEGGANLDNDNDQLSHSSSASVSSRTHDEHCGNTDHDNDFKTSSYVYADCHSSFRGIFAGLMLLIMTVVFIILLFVGVENEAYKYTSIIINDIFEVSVLLVMTGATVLAYLQTIKLDINHHPMSKLDDILLFIAIPAFFMETTFTMVPAIMNGSVLNMCISIVQIVQVLIQTPFIIDGLRRCSNAAALRKKKPGRELVIFLTIANVSLWIFYTFSVKTSAVDAEPYAFYGDTLWKILNHISLPLIMFYRFHSSVCLVDIWKHSYEPAPPEH